MCHNCIPQPSNLYPDMTVVTNPVPFPQPIQCAQCGSTAIDHTEKNCSINQMAKKLTPTEKGK